MIQQHYLQQQRLNYNHDRLLQRYHRLLPPRITEFRTFGTSSLPGRNYDQYLNTMQGKDRRRNSFVAQSRASIGSSSETYRLMGDGALETLPRNVSSIMQHSRSQSAPLVHAEKFEPVEFYEHPLYGPTPSYIRPIFNENQHLEETNDNYSDKDESENEEDMEVRSHTSRDSSFKVEHKEESKSPPSTSLKNDDNEDAERAPKGYISHKKWKAKYENLIPVNPLLFSIYTRRPNGSINKYGQSLYASPPRHRRASLDEDIFTPTSSEIESISSEIPHETSLSSHRKYHRLQSQLTPRTVISRPLEPIHTEDEFSDDESSPPDSPVPYLSRNKQNPFPSTPLITTSPSTPIITPTTLNTSAVNTIGTSPAALHSTNTSNIPPAPPMPPSLATTTTTTTTPSITRYETPSSVSITSPPPAPPMPASLTTSSSTVPYQALSNTSVPPPTAPSLAESTMKSVTFANVASTPAKIDDVSSSSDSDDDEKQKRRRRRKRQAAGGGVGDDDSSSSDD